MCIGMCAEQAHVRDVAIIQGSSTGMYINGTSQIWWRLVMAADSTMPVCSEALDVLFKAGIWHMISKVRRKSTSACAGAVWFVRGAATASPTRPHDTVVVEAL